MNLNDNVESCQDGGVRSGYNNEGRGNFRGIGKENLNGRRHDNNFNQ